MLKVSRILTAAFPTTDDPDIDAILTDPLAHAEEVEALWKQYAKADKVGYYQVGGYNLPKNGMSFEDWLKEQFSPWAESKYDYYTGEASYRRTMNEYSKKYYEEALQNPAKYQVIFENVRKFSEAYSAVYAERQRVFQEGQARKHQEWQAAAPERARVQKEKDDAAHAKRMEGLAPTIQGMQKLIQHGGLTDQDIIDYDCEGFKGSEPVMHIFVVDPERPDEDVSLDLTFEIDIEYDATGDEDYDGSSYSYNEITKFTITPPIPPELGVLDKVIDKYFQDWQGPEPDEPDYD